MARRGARYWISDLVKRHGQLTPWEQRAVIAASYGLGDEGRHWRDHRARELSDIDRAFQSWMGRKNRSTPESVTDPVGMRATK